MDYQKTLYDFLMHRACEGCGAVRKVVRGQSDERALIAHGGGGRWFLGKQKHCNAACKQRAYRERKRKGSKP